MYYAHKIACLIVVRGIFLVKAFCTRVNPILIYKGLLQVHRGRLRPELVGLLEVEVGRLVRIGEGHLQRSCFALTLDQGLIIDSQYLVLRAPHAHVRIGVSGQRGHLSLGRVELAVRLRLWHAALQLELGRLGGSSGGHRFL